MVELFTSEGCSSCPPADAVLADLAGDPRVIALSFHVDYWDELGWRDPFASPDSTSRQRAYASSFGTRSLYTPQLVVGGVDPLGGSDRGQAETDITANLDRATGVGLSVEVETDGAGSLVVETRPSGAPPLAVVNVALVQRSATSQVRAGENAGRTLQHVDIVRGFTSGTSAGPGMLRLEMPRGLRREDAQIVAFVQAAPSQGRGMPILAATQVMLPRR